MEYSITKKIFPYPHIAYLIFSDDIEDYIEKPPLFSFFET